MKQDNNKMINCSIPLSSQRAALCADENTPRLGKSCFRELVLFNKL